MLAKELIKKYGTNNAFQIAIESGIKLVYEPLGKIYAYYNAVNNSIHIDEKGYWWNREFTVAHMLYHALNNHSSNIVMWKNRQPHADVLSNNEKEGMQFAIKLLFETTKLSRLKSFREVCLVRGMTENEFQITRNEILENIHIDVENMSLSEFFNKIYDFS